METKNAPMASEWVRRYLHLIPTSGEVLDLACGGGRHTAVLRQAGAKVTAVDRDISQLGALANDAGVDALQIDLESGRGWPFSSREFDAIVVTNYLHRPLLASIVQGLKRPGVLLYETFAEGNEQFGKPSNPDFLLRPGELLEAVAGQLTVVAYEHGQTNRPRPAVVQRLCAVNGCVPALLERR